MDIWFYLFLLILVFTIFLILKIFIMKREITNIGKSLEYILKTDTNSLIKLDTTDKVLRNFASILNANLKSLRKLELEYREGNRELKSSITNISHDLRTPLTAIRGYLDLVNEDRLTDKQKKYLQIIDSKVRELTTLTEQLFDFSSTLDLANEKDRTPICLNDCLENVLAEFYGLFKEKGIAPHVDICQEKVIRLLNENILFRIFENIISNALKYSYQNFDIKLSKDGEITFSNKTDMLDKTSVEKIFDRYYTVKSAKKSHGIGLSIAKQLVELCDGSISAEYIKGSLTIKIHFKKSHSQKK